MKLYIFSEILMKLMKYSTLSLTQPSKTGVCMHAPLRPSRVNIFHKQYKHTLKWLSKHTSEPGTTRKYPVKRGGLIQMTIFGAF